MDYYQEKQLLAIVNKKDKIIGKGEKWQIHHQGILHRGFTIGLIFKDQFILQKRKHPAFDGYLDLTSSSHPIFYQGKIQTNLGAIYETLKREWELEKKDLKSIPQYHGSIVYKAKDEKSKLIEYEFFSLYLAEINFIPFPNLNFAYGFSLADLNDIKNPQKPYYNSLAPWVKKYIEKKLI